MRRLLRSCPAIYDGFLCILLLYGCGFLTVGSVESRSMEQGKLDKSFDDIIQNSTLSVHAAEFVPKSYPVKQVVFIFYWLHWLFDWSNCEKCLNLFHGTASSTTGIYT